MTQYLTPEPITLPYLMYPRFLLTAELNETERLVYILLLDRARISQKNGWIDEKGHVFLIYTIAELAKGIGKGKTTVKEALRKLEDSGWIERVIPEPGGPSHIYVKIPDEILAPAERPASSRSAFSRSPGQISDRGVVRYPASSNNERVIISSKNQPEYIYEGNTL